MTVLDLASVSEYEILRRQEYVILKNTKNAVRFDQFKGFILVRFWEHFLWIYLNKFSPFHFKEKWFFK